MFISVGCRRREEKKEKNEDRERALNNDTVLRPWALLEKVNRDGQR